MKHFPILGLTMVLGGLLTVPAIRALGDTVELPGNLGTDFMMYGSPGFLGVELREIDSDRVNALPAAPGFAGRASGGDPQSEAFDALVALQYKPAEASRLLKAIEVGTHSTEELIRLALQGAIRE